MFIPNAEFARINAAREAAGDEPFMNPRNACAGTIKQLDPAAIAQRELVFIAHGRGEVSGGGAGGFAGSHTDFCDKIKALGLPVSRHTTVCNTLDEILAAIDSFGRQRDELGYETDGMVVRLDRFDQQELLGVTSKTPRWAIAFKYAAERKTTTLIAVEHQVGKTGKITPRAVMEPVLLAGTMVRHASLHNYGQIRQKDIRIGDTVAVEKAGEIIPYVVEPVVSERPDSAEVIVPPAVCPVCGGVVEIEPPEAAEDPSRETARRCMNPGCPAQLREKLGLVRGSQPDGYRRAGGAVGRSDPGVGTDPA